MDKKKVNVADILINNGIIILIFLMVIFVGVTKENFFSGSNFSNVSINVACRFIIAVGVSGCLITKGTDLSAGRVVGLAACLAGTLLQKADYSGRFELTKNFPQLNVWVILLICIAICCIFGLINGIVISYLSVPAFIGTLGMQMIVYGINLVYTKSIPIGGYRTDYTAIANGKLFGVFPYLFIIAIVIGLIMWFVYNYTRHGKYMYAIGGNEAAAEVAGVNVKRTKIKINFGESYSGETEIYVRAVLDRSLYRESWRDCNNRAVRVNALLDKEIIVNNFEWKVEHTALGTIYFNY